MNVFDFGVIDFAYRLACFIRSVSIPLLQLYLFHRFFASTLRLLLGVRVIDSACSVYVRVSMSVVVMFLPRSLKLTVTQSVVLYS